MTTRPSRKSLLQHPLWTGDALPGEATNSGAAMTNRERNFMLAGFVLGQAVAWAIVIAMAL